VLGFKVRNQQAQREHCSQSRSRTTGLNQTKVLNSGLRVQDSNTEGSLPSIPKLQQVNTLIPNLIEQSENNAHTESGRRSQ
jgi:hypothetical protein